MLAGLDKAELPAIELPSFLLKAGARVLNEKFEKRTGKPTTTILLLIDEYDKPFHSAIEAGFNQALIHVLGIGKLGNQEEISLMVFAGLTSIDGIDYQLSTILVVNRRSEFHGICGISVQEILHSAERASFYCGGTSGSLIDALDERCQLHWHQNFKGFLTGRFREKRNTFRFCLDAYRKSVIDPEDPDHMGALFLPEDVWFLFRLLTKGRRQVDEFNDV